MKKALIFSIFLLPLFGLAQMPSHFENVSFRPFDRYVYAVDSFHTSVRPYLMDQVDPIVSIDTLYTVTTKSKFLNYILNKNVIKFKKNDVWFTINPYINFGMGKSSDTSKKSYTNTRGFILNGEIGKKVAFASTFRENQALFADYRNGIVQSLGVIPGQGAYKPFKVGAYDWGFATGVISYSPSKHFNFQLGTDKNFFGDGYRSLFLSDNSTAYPFFKITTDFWKIKYVNLWCQFTDVQYPTREDRDMGYAKKWASIQYLSWNTTKWFNISVFESVMWGNADSLGNYRGFDFSYANPVIFLRPVEFENGSPDNVMMGGNLKVTIKKKYILYSQALIDEFNLKEMKENTGYWANKYGYQIGAKTFDLLGLKHFDIQGEYNRVRPFTYSHWSTLQCWGNFNQPLAHPLGANFEEFVGIARYNKKRLFVDCKLVIAHYGTSTKTFNAGENVFADYTKNHIEYGNVIGQGLEKTLRQTDISLSYMINPLYNLNVTAGITNRHLEGVTTNLVYFALRTSLDNMFFDY